MDEREAEARFTRLCETYYRNVFGYVVLRVAPQAAVNVTGEVFTVAWRKVDESPAAQRRRRHQGIRRRVPRLRAPGLGEQARRRPRLLTEPPATDPAPAAGSESPGQSAWSVQSDASARRMADARRFRAARSGRPSSRA